MTRHRVAQFLRSSLIGQKVIRPILKVLDVAGGLAIRTKAGAKVVGFLIPGSRPVVCSACFSDRGLQFDAERIGILHALPCPHCGSKEAKKLTPYLLQVLASQFFVRGSVLKADYGSAPMIQFNEHRYQNGDYEGPKWLRKDAALISEKAKIGLFHYGPRLWMLGLVEPLEALQEPQTRDDIITRILKEYPERILPQGEVVYRLRANPADPIADLEYDSPPAELLGGGRLDAKEHPVLYCSQDIEGCVHECRVTVEDELYLASLEPTRDLRLLDLTALLSEEDVTEFESLDMAVHMLFYAADHSYELSRAVSIEAKKAGFNGILYPSYFSQVRSGSMPFETVYGISIRRFQSAKEYAVSGIFTNVALLGHPIKEKLVKVACINRLILHKVNYELRFGPVREEFSSENDLLDFPMDGKPENTHNKE